MNPTNNEEVNKKVQELLNKGLIRESLSPCVLLAILTLQKIGERRCAWIIESLIG